MNVCCALSKTPQAGKFYQARKKVRRGKKADQIAHLFASVASLVSVGKDPVQFRLELFSAGPPDCVQGVMNAQRIIDVVELVAEK